AAAERHAEVDLRRELALLELEAADLGVEVRLADDDLDRLPGPEGALALAGLLERVELRRPRLAESLAFERAVLALASDRHLVALAVRDLQQRDLQLGPGHGPGRADSGGDGIARRE